MIKKIYRFLQNAPQRDFHILLMILTIIGCMLVLLSCVVGWDMGVSNG